MQVVVYGAGSVGSVLGGMLAINHHEVILVGREPLVTAIHSGGLRLKSSTGERLARPTVVEKLSRENVPAGACVLLTVKSHDVPAAVAELEDLVSVDTPIVCFQNGMAAEPIVASRFAQVYGGVVRMTCSMIQPGHASFQAPGRIIIGHHPKGSDRFTLAASKAFREAGFDAAASRTIESDKWLKLALNTVSVVHAAVDLRDHDTNEFQELKACILDEVKRVYKAARVKARSCDGRDPTIEEMAADLRRPRARRSSHGVKLHNSLWQDLYRKRDRIESDFIHGPIIALGTTHNVPTPYNSAMMDVAQKLHDDGAAPESLRLTDLVAVVEAHRQA
jgi:2-dehydropantoate 2-reductase